MHLFKGVVFLYLGLLSCKVVAQEVHKVELMVDTRSEAPDKSLSFKVGQHTTILEGQKQFPFAFFARVGDQIKWSAVSSTETSVPVSIIGLKYIKGPRIFSSDVLHGKNGVEATIIRGGEERYTYQLLFKIGSATKVYTISSQIQIGD
jgi:hypothetical protein